MTIIEAIRKICDETIPKEIDGLTIHVVIKEEKIPFVGNIYRERYRITILPSCRADNIGVSTEIPKDLFPVDRADSELTYDFLKKKGEDLFLLFVRGIIKNFERSKA